MLGRLQVGAIPVDPRRSIIGDLAAEAIGENLSCRIAVRLGRRLRPVEQRRPRAVRLELRPRLRLCGTRRLKTFLRKIRRAVGRRCGGLLFNKFGGGRLRRRFERGDRFLIADRLFALTLRVGESIAD